MEGVPFPYPLVVGVGEGADFVLGSLEGEEVGEADPPLALQVMVDEWWALLKFLD